MKNANPIFNKNYYTAGEILLPNLSETGRKPGNQIFHYCSENIDVNQHYSSAEYIKKHFSNTTIFENDAGILQHGINTSDKNGLMLEFGVCSGKTINFIAALNSFNTIYGFDSFLGLPDNWKPTVPKGTFKLLNNSTMPPLLANVQIIEGLFEDTLPAFVEKIENSFISFIHIDCDLYVSTQTVFKHLKNNIRKGTIILFDEYFNYDGWENHEHKAFMEFIKSTELSFRYIAYNRFHEQVLVEIC